ncbi:DUF1566 domain-containing protein [bacterium]|nr:DUF1566 domain-containing protein [bacterium]
MLSEETFTWEDAITHCEDLNYGGYTDWRLPDPIELLPIVNHSKSSPAVDALYFQISSDAWSSKSHNTTNALSFGSDFGTIWYRKEKTSPLKVMCVRGNKLTKLTFTTSTTNGDVVVKDSITGLIWQKTYVTGKTWQEALKYCEDLTYAGKSDWRLPNKNEQASLLNFEKSIPYSDFQDMPKEKAFWTNSTNAEYEHKTYAWHTNFSYGTNTDKKKISDPYFAVRCVRSEKINDPCENHICGSAAHSSGVCIPENAFEYSCACDSGYFWNGTQCKIMPECSASSGTPCKDSTSGLIWSNRVDNKTWQQAIDYCDSYTEDGLRGWHLPNIDELKNLLVWNKANSCKVSETNDCLSYDVDCWSCSTCVANGVQTSGSIGCDSWGTTYTDGRYSIFGDKNYF